MIFSEKLDDMELTEEEIRRALFGGSVPPALAFDTHEKDIVPDSVTMGL